MSIKPVDERIDAMAIAAADETTETGNTLTQQQALTPPQMTLEETPEDAMQVAGKREGLIGLGKVMKEVFQAEPPAVTDPLKRIEKPTPDAPEIKPGDIPVDVKKELRKSAPVRVVGDKVIVQPESVETIRKVDEIIRVMRLDDGSVSIRPNMNRIESSDDAKRFYAASTEYYKDLIETQRRAGRTNEDILDDATRGVVVNGAEKYIRMLLNRKPGDAPFTDDESLAARLSMVNWASNLSKDIQLALNSNDPAALADAALQFKAFSYANAAELGNRAEYGRGLSAYRIVAPASETRVREMQRFAEKIYEAKPPKPPKGFAGAEDAGMDLSDAMAEIESMGGIDNVKMALQGFLALPDMDAKNTFAARLMRGGRLMLDSASEIYTSALVSNPVTHAFNILGTPIHASMMLAERYAAATMRGDKELQASILAGVRAMPRYFNQAMAAGTRAFKTEMPSDMATKFDQDRVAVTPQNFGVAPDTMLGKTIDYWGQGMRLLGFRMLTTTDETFKGLLRGLDMEITANYEAGKAFNYKLDNGGTVEEATNLARDAYQKAMVSDAVFDQASEFARIAAFQDDLPGSFLAGAQQVMTHPVAKLMGFPFFKTPMQIALRVQERSPLAITMPRFWKAMFSPATEEERSLALAKLGTGFMIGGTFMTADYFTGENVIFTGYGPSRPAERARWLEKHQPYSIGVKNDDGSYTWIDYSRYDPVSGIIAGWMDTRDTILKMEDPEAEENLIVDMGLATFHYMTETHPMIDFVSEINYVMGPSFDPTEDKAKRIQELLQKQVTDVAMNVGQSMVTGGLYPQSLAASLQRYNDPFARSTLPEDQYDYLNGPGFRISLRGAYESIQKARTRNPMFADDTFIRHNEWYEPEETSPANLTAFLPLRIRTKQFNGINTELEKLGGGFDRLQPSMGEPMIKLNDQQMERYKELYNYPFRSAFALELLGGIDTEVVNAMTDEQRAKALEDIRAIYPPRAEALMSFINSEEYTTTFDEDTQDMRAAEKGEKLDRLKAQNSVYRAMAKKLMLAENPELRSLIEQRDAYEQRQGRKPRNLPLSSETLQKITQ